VLYDVHCSLIACVENFPGLGETTIDPHEQLPSIEAIPDTMIIYFEKVSIDKLYRSIGFIVGHITVKNLFNKAPASLNNNIIELLKNSCNHKGLIYITDALDMKAFSGIVDVEVWVLQAGCHLLLCSKNVPAPIFVIKNGIKNGILTMTKIDNAVKTILKNKIVSH